MANGLFNLKQVVQAVQQGGWPAQKPPAVEYLVVAGGGGGGAGWIAEPGFIGGAGGSGIVIIRYPSYQVAATSTTGGPEMYIANGWRVYKFVASGTITF